MTDILSGRRLGPFIVIQDSEGLRHAIRPGAVIAISDADDLQGTAYLSLPGGRCVLIHSSFDDILRLFA